MFKWTITNKRTQNKKINCFGEMPLTRNLYDIMYLEKELTNKKKKKKNTVLCIRGLIGKPSMGCNKNKVLTHSILYCIVK